MEKIAIISDIHANLTALQATLNDIEKRDISRIICLGDIVYKGVSPTETIDLVKEKCDVVLQGNCDEFLARDTALKNKHWSRIKIGEQRAKYLKQLPVCHEFYMSGYLVRLFHASPFDLTKLFNPMYKNANKEDREIVAPEEMFKNTEFIGKSENDKVPDIVGYGHIHTPNIVRFKNKMIFNPGSVGIPAEMLNSSTIEETSKFSCLASYMIMEGEYGSKELSSIGIELFRVPYSLQTEIERVEKSDNPQKEEIIRKLQTAEP